ncbi:MAG: LysE family translocator [Pseudonocardiaceae bacterium]
MVGFGQLLGMSLVALVVIAAPGPSVLFVISRGVSLGRNAALATVVGNEIGLSVQAVAVAFGLGAIVAYSVATFTALKLVGAGYLIYLGVRALRHRHDLAAALNATASPTGARRILLDGVVVGVTNPKSLLLFGAILPQFANPAAGHVPLQLLVFGLVCVAIALVCDASWALLAAAARSWLGRSPRRLSILGGTAGVIMIGLGAQLALTGRRD